MANFNDIKHEIDQNVNTNGVQAITGAILNETLKDMIDEVDSKKQDTLVAGSGIAINGNVISATGSGSGDYEAGFGINSSELQNGRITVDPSQMTGNGINQEDGHFKINPNIVQEKLTAGQNITISSSNVISATDTTYSAGQGLDLNGTTFSVDYDEVQEKLESGQNIKTVNGYSLLGSGDIVIGGGGGGNYLPLEGGTLQNTAPGEDTELKVIDGMDEDYVKIVAPESQGEKPHVEIFENGSGDTKIYYDHIERGSQVSIDLPSSSGTLALTTDIPEAGSGLIENQNGEFEVDTTAIQEKLVAGQNITIQGNVISASGGSGQSYVAGNGIDITGNTISVDNTVATTSDLAGYLPLTGGTLKGVYTGGIDYTTLDISSPNNYSSINFHANDNSFNATGKSTIEMTDSDGYKVYGTDGISDGTYTLSFPTLSQNEILATQSDVNTAVSGKQDTLTAGSGISIVNNVISATGGGGSSYSAGNGIDITNNTISVDATDLDGAGLTTNQNGELVVDTNVIQGKLTAGSGIYISSNNVISATGGGGSGLWVPGTGTASIISPGGADPILSPVPSEANGQGAISMGLGTRANGDFSVAIGNTGSATGDGSVSINGTTYANEAFTVGGYASGVSSVAIGFGSEAKRDYEVGLGKYNYSSLDVSSPSKETAFSIGDGTSSSARSNSFEIKKNSDIYVNGIGGYTGRNGGSTGIKSLQTVISSKQETLISGTNIKTINGSSIIGSGDLVVSGGSSYSQGPGITINQNNQISANPDGSNIILDSNNQLNLDFVGVAGNLQGNGLQVDSSTGTTLEVDFSQIPSQIAGNGLQVNSDNGTLEIDTTTIASDLSGSFLPLEGGALQQMDTDNPQTSLYVLSPDSVATGYIYSYSEDTSDPQNPIPAFVELGLQGQSSGSADTTQGIYLRSNGTIAVDYIVDSQGNADMVELEFPRKASGQTYTLATLDDIQGGGSYVAGNGINISGSTISVDTGYLDGEYLPLTGGQLKANPSDAETLLDVAAPDSTSAISMSADTIDSKLAISADKTNAGISDGDTFRTVLSNTGEIQVSAKTVNPQDPTDIGETTYTLVLPQKNDTIATLSDIQGGGSYSAGAGINIDANNVISNTAPGLWTSGTGTNSLLSPAAKTYGNANGNYSVSAGSDTKAEGIASFAMGYSSKALGNYSLVGGQNSETGYTSANSIAFGQNAKAKSVNAFVFGSYSSVETNSANAVAIGNNAISSSTNACAIGLATRAKNAGEIALGPFNNSINSGTTAEKTSYTIGNGTAENARSNLIEAKQNNDIYVVGVGGFDGTNAGQSGVETLQQAIDNAGGGGGASLWTSGTGTDSLLGPGSIGADGDNSMAAGEDSNAQANGSVALGGGVVIYDDSDPNNIINAEYGVAIGTGATVETAGSLAMMGGTASSQNGSSHNSVAIGDGATAEGMYDVALTGSSSSGNYSFAASTGIAVGHYSTGLSGGEARGEGAFAAGQGNGAYGYSAAALGYMAQTYDQANGALSTDPNAGEVALGRYNYSEQGIVFTVGCGYYDETDPDNPVEVRQNAVAIDSTGKIFLKGLGGYTGTSTSGCTDLATFLSNL